MTINIDIAYQEDSVVPPVEPKVYTKTEYQQEWTLNPFLTCQRITFSTGEKDSMAVLRSHYGSMIPAGFSAFMAVPRDNLIRSFVKVEITFPDGSARNWEGVIVASQAETSGTSSTQHYGDFSYVAYGFEWFLRRYQVIQSYSFDENAPEVVGGWVRRYYTVPCGLPFNAGGGNAGDERVASYGNKNDIGAGGNADLLFSNGGYSELPWTAMDILNYLTLFHQPCSTSSLAWGIWPTSRPALEWYEPRNVPTHGRTLRDIINQVIDKRRGLTYSFIGQSDVLVHTYFSEDISLPSGHSVPANERCIALTLSSRRRTPVIEWLDHSNKYEQVIVQGARITRTLTLQANGAHNGSYSLDADWTSDQQTSYFTAATGATGYADMSVSEKEIANEAYWMTYPVRRVFTHFKLNSSAPWGRGLQLSLTTPMIQGVDYSASIPDASTVPAGEYQSNLAFINFGSRYLPINDIAGASTHSEEMDRNGIKFHVHVQEYENKRGVIIAPTCPAHAIAFSDAFFSGDLPQYSPDSTPVCDYKAAYITCTIEENDRLTVRYPNVPDDPINNCASKQVISLGDDVRKDIIQSGTAIGVDKNGALITTAEGGSLRDDEEFCQDVARMAYEWYKVERQAIRFEINHIDGQLRAGDLIVSVQYNELLPASPVNTIISSVTYDFDSQQTSINTDLAEELDFRALAAK